MLSVAGKENEKKKETPKTGFQWMEKKNKKKETLKTSFQWQEVIKKKERNS